MATRSGEESKLLLKVEYGTTASGNTTYRTRTLSNINPDLSDNNAYSIMTKLGAMQTHTVAEIKREDIATLTS